MIRPTHSAIALAIVCIPFVSLAAVWTDKTVGVLQAMHIDSDCFYFTLNGVTQADPVFPGNAFFAVARSQNGSKDAYALLLTARLSGTPVTVYTDGITACGYPRAISVHIN